MKVITVCGSMKFIKEMIEIAETLEMQGNCMLMSLYNPFKTRKDDYTQEEAIILDEMHKERIKLAHAILVLDVDHYIGESTKKEIQFAKKLNKEIIYYSHLIQ